MSLSAWFNYFFLAKRLSKKWGEPLFDKTVFKSLFKTATCALIAAVATLYVGKFFAGDPTMQILSGEVGILFERSFTMQLMQFVAI